MLGFAELSDPFAQRATDLSQSSDAEDDEDDEQYYNEFSWTHLKRHGSTSNPAYRQAGPTAFPTHCTADV